MKRALIRFFVIAALGLGASPLQGQEPESWPPKAYPLSRYESAWSRNPFDLKTTPPAVPTVAPQPGESFATHLVIAGMTKVGTQDTLILYDQQNTRYYRVTGSTGSGGFRLVSIQHHRDLRKVVARIAKGSEEAEVRYARKAPAKGGKGSSPAGRPPGAAKGGNPDIENGRN